MPAFGKSFAQTAEVARPSIPPTATRVHSPRFICLIVILFSFFYVPLLGWSKREPYPFSPKT